MKAIILILFMSLLPACQTIGKRAGITSNPDRRQKEWLKRYPTMYNWTLIKCGLTYDQAQKIEDNFRAKGYDAKAGGMRKSGKNYCAYTFYY